MSAGRHRRPSKTSALTAAAPAVTAAAVAAVIAAANPAQARVLPAAPPSPPVAAQTDYTVHAHLIPAGPRKVIVVAGDTLSGLAAGHCGDERYWTGLYEGNKAVIGADPDVIQIGTDLVLDCRQAAYTPPPVHVTAADVTAPRKVYAAPAGGNVNPGDYSGFQQCVITRESGGRSQVMNSSGHYGLYQFSASTWQAYGGSSADFGHASVAEQNRVFGNAMARGGESNWSPYDGC